MLRKTISLFIICALLLAFPAAAGAAEIDSAAVGARLDAAIVAADYEEVGSVLLPTGALPSAYSSRELGYTTPVRDQLYNTCWAYCSTAVLETQLLRMQRYPYHLSTMHMNYWGCPREDGTGWQRSYSAAGYSYIALGYMTSFGCIPEYRFSEDRSIEDYDVLNSSLYPFYTANSIIYLESKDRDTIKTAIYEYGAMIGNFHYSGSYTNDDSSAYYCDLEGLTTSQLSGHAIEIVGWDDNYSASNFNSDHRPSSDGAWLCKNSWGTSYGDRGYFWISYEDQYLFDTRFGPCYAITEISPMTAVHKMQQDETFGAIWEFDYIEQINSRLNKLTYANVLDFSDGYHNIDKVIFESTSEGSAYTVYYIPLDDQGVPTDDASKWMLLAQGTIENQGYVCANVYGFNAPQEKAAIGVQIEKASSDGHIAIGVAEWLTASSSGQKLFIPEAKYGDSYLIGYRSTPMDVMDFYKTVMQDDVGGTFVIKALCHNDEKAGDVDRDGVFTIFDVTTLQRYNAEMCELDGTQLRFADFDNDGEADITDCTRMQRSLAGLSD